jgi:hypothetical protein
VVPTKYPRIPITKDGALAEALDNVAGYFPDKRPATMVHDLAIRGARAVLDDEATRKHALQWLVEWSTNPDSSLDRELLKRIDEEAW